MVYWLKRFETLSTPVVAVVTAVLLSFVGALDFATGVHLSFSAFYLLPVSFAAWTRGSIAGFVAAVLSVVIWAAVGVSSGDINFVTPYIVTWNAAIQLLTCIVVVFALTSLHALQRELEARVAQRAAALTAEIANRERLQRELLHVSEREQRRFGQDLHDGLCQHLAATAIAGQVLGDKLVARNLNEAKDARKVVELIEQGIILSHQLAKGLHPVEMDAAGLMQALQEFAANTSELHKVSCRFECDSPVLIHDPGTAEHMFRIAQEAVRNAIKHSGAREIVIRLEAVDEGLLLLVEDDGSGIKPDPQRTAGSGMGLRIMAHRSHVIGAIFELRDRPQGGTIVACLLPASAQDAPREQAFV
ncbi:MAG TPA: ATP-binding protein [Rhizomicrobium sp.]|nr:ATP-binding protein [Rhizomicrobium sp.]